MSPKFTFRTPKNPTPGVLFLLHGGRYPDLSTGCVRASPDPSPSSMGRISTGFLLSFTRGSSPRNHLLKLIVKEHVGIAYMYSILDLGLDVLDLKKNVRVHPPDESRGLSHSRVCNRYVKLLLWLSLLSWGYLNSRLVYPSYLSILKFYS